MQLCNMSRLTAHQAALALTQCVQDKGGSLPCPQSERPSNFMFRSLLKAFGQFAQLGLDLLTA